MNWFIKAPDSCIFRFLRVYNVNPYFIMERFCYQVRFSTVHKNRCYWIRIKEHKRKYRNAKELSDIIIISKINGRNHMLTKFWSLPANKLHNMFKDCNANCFVYLRFENISDNQPKSPNCSNNIYIDGLISYVVRGEFNKV